MLSIIYFFIGIYLFEKRKMEVNETSFKSTHSHMLVKSLTLIPIGVFYMILIDETSSVMVNIFVFGLIIAYCLIYDLITSKSIRSFKLGIIYFVITAILTAGIYYGVDNINKNRGLKTKFNVLDIQSVSCYIDEVDYTQKYPHNKYNKMNGVYLNDHRLLEIVKENMQDSIYKECSMRVNLKLNNDEEYKTDVYLNTEEYNEIVALVLNNEVYKKEYIDIDYSKVYSLSVGDFVITGSEMDKALEKLKDILKNVKLMDAYKLPQINTTIDLELYEEHENKTYNIPLNIHKELLEEYIKQANKSAKEISNEELDIYSLRVFNYEETMASYYSQILEEKCRLDLAKYVKQSTDEQVDVYKPMLRIRMSAVHNGEYKNKEYFTNNVLEFIKIANNKMGGELYE